MIKKYVIKCEDATCCTLANLEDWFWDSNPKERDIISFDTRDEAEKFIKEFELCEASKYMSEPMPTIEISEEYKQAEMQQLKLNF